MMLISILVMHAPTIYKTTQLYSNHRFKLLSVASSGHQALFIYLFNSMFLLFFAKRLSGDSYIRGSGSGYE